MSERFFQDITLKFYKLYKLFFLHQLNYRWDIKVEVKLVPLVEGNPKTTFFNSYYTEVSGRALLLSLDGDTLPLKPTL